MEFKGWPKTPRLSSPFIITETAEERKKRLARERSRRFREAHPHYERDKSRARRRENPGYRWPGNLAVVQEVNELKSSPCVDCGGTFPTVCMDFDHVPERGPKGWNVGSMVSHGYSRELILSEIAKCDLVCANCHRIRTNRRTHA